MACVARVRILLPTLPRRRLLQRLFDVDFVEWLNLTISALNILHGDGWSGTVSRFSPTRAQHRVWCQLVLVLDSFRASLIPWPSLAVSRSARRHDRGAGYATSSGLSNPIGLRGGAPASAALVDTASAVEATFPTISAQIRNLSILLLPPVERPRVLRRPNAHLAKT